MAPDVILAPHRGGHSIFLSGPPGAGKTDLAVRRLIYLLEQGVLPDELLVLVPQRTLAWPYYSALRAAGARVRVATLSGLARQFVERFWAQVAGPARLDARRPPQFLTFETAQYVMNRVTEPYLAAGAFEGVAVSRPRLLAQLLDNLDRAAAIGLPAEEIAARLKAAWGGESARERIYDQVQAVALSFRRACLDQNLLDWSLQVEVFDRHVLALPEAREALFGGYKHLIADNSEENPPLVHDLLRQWLPRCESALVIHDSGGGYRLLLGADPAGSLALAQVCGERVELAESHVPSPDVAELGARLAARLGHPLPGHGRPGGPRPEVHFEARRFYPEMLDWAAEQVSRLVMEEGLPAAEIAVLPPFINDALRFALTERLARYGIALSVLRPSRALSGDAAVRGLLTWARLAHPAWELPPSADDVAHALALSVSDLDPIRARLLADIVYRVRDGRPALSSFQQIVPATRERIGFLLGGRYDELWRWLQGNGHESLPLFVRRLVDEVLAQPGFGFAPGSAAAAAAATLIESAEKFVAAVTPLRPAGESATALGPEYVELVEGGIVAGQYLASWEPAAQPGVLLASPLTFVLLNRPVRAQLWLDVGSRAWFERVYQPLSQPYVLSRDWPVGRVWTDQDEVQARSRALAQLVAGLTYRCRDRVYLGYSELNEQGHEQRGPLLRAIAAVIKG